MTTRADLKRAIKLHKGKVEMPVLVPEDVNYIFVEKKDIYRILDNNPGGRAPWYIVDTSDGVMRLDVNHYGR